MSQSLELAERALALAEGDAAEAVVTAERSGFARYAAGEVHQPTLIDDTVVHLRVIRDGRSGSASTNRIDDEGLADLARRAGEAAASADPDPDLAPLAPPVELPEAEGYDEGTAALGADDQARLAEAAIAASDGLGLYGFFTSGVCELAIASTTALRASERTTDATCLALAASDDVSGYAERTSWRVGEIDPAAVAREAVAKAERTRGAVDAPPARYRAVLEPYAIAELLYYTAFDMFNGQALLEERSWFAGRIGERKFDPKITLMDDALDPQGLPRAFDFEGTPKQRVELVENGVARDVVWDRGTAAKAGDGRVSTGHAPQDAWRFYGPLPTAFSMAGGDAASLDDLAERVGDGIYVTRLHYLSVVDPRGGVLTGMTRDGTFRIRDGKVAEPLVNLRFTVPIAEVLGEVLGLTSEPLLMNMNELYDERFPHAALVPALATARFHISGAGSGPGL